MTVMPIETNDRRYARSREVGRNVHLILWERRISQVDFAAMLGWNPQTLADKLRNKVRITVDELYQLADALGVDVADLLPRRDSNLQPTDSRSDVDLVA